jgi:hypothetical protein
VVVFEGLTVAEIEFVKASSAKTVNVSPVEHVPDIVAEAPSQRLPELELTEVGFPGVETTDMDNESAGPVQALSVQAA